MLDPWLHMDLFKKCVNYFNNEYIVCVYNVRGCLVNVAITSLKVRIMMTKTTKMTKMTVMLFSFLVKDDLLVK